MTDHERQVVMGIVHGIDSALARIVRTNERNGLTSDLDLARFRALVARALLENAADHRRAAGILREVATGLLAKISDQGDTTTGSTN